MKIYRVKRFLKSKVDRVKILIGFPHIWLCLIIIFLSLTSLMTSFVLEQRGLSYISSIFSNIFAGLLTGLIICLVSGLKQLTAAKLISKKNWLLHIREMINDYHSMYHELLTKPFEKYDGSEELFNFIYDVGSRANWVNDDILQSSFNKTLLFDPCIYCRKNFNYDAVVLADMFERLHNDLQMVDVDNPSKKAILGYFKNVDDSLRRLRASISADLGGLEVRLKMLNSSIL